MQYIAYVHIHTWSSPPNHPRSHPSVWGDAVPGSYWWHHPRWNTIQISLATPHSWHLGWPWLALVGLGWPWSPWLGPMIAMVSPWYPHGIPMVSPWDGDRIEDPGEPFKMNRWEPWHRQAVPAIHFFGFPGATGTKSIWWEASPGLCSNMFWL